MLTRATRVVLLVLTVESFVDTGYTRVVLLVITVVALQIIVIDTRCSLCHCSLLCSLTLLTLSSTLVGGLRLRDSLWSLRDNL